MKGLTIRYIYIYTELEKNISLIIYYTVELLDYVYLFLN